MNFLSQKRLEVHHDVARQCLDSTSFILFLFPFLYVARARVAFSGSYNQSDA